MTCCRSHTLWLSRRRNVPVSFPSVFHPGKRGTLHGDPNSHCWCGPWNSDWRKHKKLTNLYNEGDHWPPSQHAACVKNRNSPNLSRQTWSNVEHVCHYTWLKAASERWGNPTSPFTPPLRQLPLSHSIRSPYLPLEVVPLKYRYTCIGPWSCTVYYKLSHRGLEHRKLNMVHLSRKIWHLMAPIFILVFGRSSGSVSKLQPRICTNICKFVSKCFKNLALLKYFTISGTRK